MFLVLDVRLASKAEAKHCRLGNEFRKQWQQGKENANGFCKGTDPTTLESVVNSSSHSNIATYFSITAYRMMSLSFTGSCACRSCKLRHAKLHSEVDPDLFKLNLNHFRQLSLEVRAVKKPQTVTRLRVASLQSGCALSTLFSKPLLNADLIIGPLATHRELSVARPLPSTPQVPRVWTPKMISCGKPWKLTCSARIIDHSLPIWLA